MQCACAILLSVACPALWYFSTLSHKLYDFRQNVIEHKTCVSISSTNPVWNISHSTKKWSEIHVLSKLSSGLHVKYPLFLSDFNETGTFWTVFRELFKYHIQWKSFQWQPNCSMRTDGRTDMTKLIVAFRIIANAPKNDWIRVFWHYSLSPHTAVIITDFRELTYPSKTKIKRRYIYRSSPYRAVNTLRLGYKNQSMLYEEIIAICSEIQIRKQISVTFKDPVRTAQ